MFPVNIKQEPDEVTRQNEAAEVDAALNRIIISQLDDPHGANLPQQPPSGSAEAQSSETGNLDSRVKFEILEENENITANVSDLSDPDDILVAYGEEILTDEADIQAYEELMNRISAEVVIREPIASRFTVSERIKKINSYTDDGTNFQMIVLSDEITNSNAWSTFRYPRNLDDFLEIIFNWADNFLNNQNWPQEDIITRLKAFPFSLRYGSFRIYSKAAISYLLVLYYDRLKRDGASIIKSQELRDKGILATVHKIVAHDVWSEVVFILSYDNDNYKFGLCCILSVIESCIPHQRLFFGTILGKKSIKRNGVNVTYLTIKSLEFVPFVGDKFTITPLFRIHHIYTAAECLFDLESEKCVQHYTSPSLSSGPSGTTLNFDDESLNLTPFDCDAVYKAVDTCSLSSDGASPVCCLDFRDMDKSLKDLADIVVQILISMRSVPIDTRRIGFDIPALVICNNEEVLSTLHEKFKKANFPIYRLNRNSGVPANLKHKIPKIGKSLARALSIAKLEDAAVYKELDNKWDFADEGIFSTEDEENKFNDIMELAKAFAIRNSAVILGQMYDIANDTILNSAFCDFPVCIILGASSIPEVFTLSLMKYCCEKFILIDRETTPWPGNKSMFTRLVSLYETDHSVIKGAKCCVVTAAKKQLIIPDPPKQSRHKLIEEGKKDQSSSSSANKPGGYKPEQRKNPRNRLPFCPRPSNTTINSDANEPKTKNASKQST